MSQFYKDFIQGKYERLIVLGGLLLILMCGLYRLSMHFGICILDDEFAYWGMGAQMSGLDWSELLSTTSFYSYGYGILLIPLYLTGLPVAVMYQIAIIINTGLVMGSFALAYWVASQVFTTVDKKLLALAALLVTLYSNNIVQMHIGWGECTLYCLFWLIMALICRIIQRKKLIDMILLAIAAVYIYTVHNRALGVLVTVVAFMIFFYLLSLAEKNPRHHFLAGLLCIVVLFLAASWFRQYTIDNWYANNAIISVNDYSGNVPKVKELTSLSKLWDLFISFAAKSFAQATASFLLIIPPVIITIGYTGKSLIGRLLRRPQPAWSLRDWMFLGGTAAYLLELAISAFYKSSPTITAHNFFYSRYSDFAIGPLILFGFCLLIEQRARLRVMIGSLVIYILCAIVSYTQIQRATEMTLNNFHAVGIYRFFIDLAYPTQAVIRMFVAGTAGFILMAGSSLFLKRMSAQKAAEKTAEDNKTDSKAEAKAAGKLTLKNANKGKNINKSVNNNVKKNMKGKSVYKNDTKGLKAARATFLACICAAGIYWAVSGLQTTGEWLLLNWNQGQRIVARIQTELAKLDEDTEIYYIIGGAVNHPRNAMMHLKTLQAMEPYREIHLVAINNLPENYEGNYVYMSGSDEELVQAIVSLNKQMLYNSAAQIIYGDEGTEAARVLKR